MPKVAQARERIVEAAWQLFWQRGYHATSIADIAKAAKLPKGSIYNYFESKAALLRSVLGRLRYQTETQLRLKVLEGTLSPSELAAKLLTHYEELYEKAGWGMGDPLSGRLAELVGTDPELVAQLRPLQDVWRAVVTQKIWAYATTSRVPQLTEWAEPLAALIYNALQGALLEMKIAQSREPLREARRSLLPMIASFVTAIAAGEVGTPRGEEE